MNYLAHAFLSPDHSDILTGNIICDMVKGNLRKEVSENFSSGMSLHHFIDDWTDRNPLVIEMVNILTMEFGRYSSVFLDIFMDYLLCRNWGNFSNLSIENFRSKTYQLLFPSIPLLPNVIANKLTNMIQHDWLSVYSSISGINSVFLRMQNRIGYDNRSVNPGDWLESYEKQLTPLFNKFFDEIVFTVKQNHANIYTK